MITTAEIKDWFNGWLTPGEDDLQDLALALNIMRVTVRRKDTADIKRRAVKNDIEALLRNLPALIEIERRTFELWANSPSTVKHGLLLRKVFDDLLSAAQQADKFLGRTAKRRREANWFGDALWIAARLQMLGEKSDRAVGLTKDECPGVQFIDTALKRACPNDAVTDSSIARAMARNKELVTPYRV